LRNYDRLFFFLGASGIWRVRLETGEDGGEDRVWNAVPMGAIGTNEDGDEDRVRNAVPMGAIGTKEDGREDWGAFDSKSKNRARFLSPRTGPEPEPREEETSRKTVL
jgi:hypothetical protein